MCNHDHLNCLIQFFFSLIQFAQNISMSQIKHSKISNNVVFVIF